MSSAIGKTLNADFDLKHFGMIGSGGAYRNILWCAHFFSLRPLLQTTLWIVDIIEDKFLGSLQQRVDKRFHSRQTSVQIQRTDHCFEQRSQQPVTLAPSGGKFSASQAQRRPKVQVSCKYGELIVPHDGRAYLGQLPFPHFRETIVNPRSDNKVEYGISQKFEALVVLQRVGVFVNV